MGYDARPTWSFHDACVADPTDLRRVLARYETDDPREARDLERMRRYAVTLAEPFSRHGREAHFTGSALVIDPDARRVCLVHHARFDRWLQPGGHHESGDAGRLERTALREAAEETGCRVALRSPAPAADPPLPLDVDIHPIAARPGEPAHLHLDLRYLVVALDPEALAPDARESRGAEWLAWADAEARAGDDDGLRRLLLKAWRAVDA